MNSYFAPFSLTDARLHVRVKNDVKDPEPILASIREKHHVLTGLELPLRRAGDVVEIGGNLILATRDRAPVSPKPGDFKRFAEIHMRSLPNAQDRSEFIRWLASIGTPRQSLVPCLVGPCHAGKGLLVKSAALVIQSDPFIQHRTPRTSIVADTDFSKIRVRNRPEDLESVVHCVNLTNAKVSGPELGALICGEDVSIPIQGSQVKCNPGWVFILRCHSETWPSKESHVKKIVGDRLLIIRTSKEKVDLFDALGEFLSREALHTELREELPAFMHYLLRVRESGALLPPLT